MKYYVIATKWSGKEKAQAKYIAGEFSEYMNAVLFRDAYNKYYCADAAIVDVKDLVKAFDAK